MVFSGLSYCFAVKIGTKRREALSCIDVCGPQSGHRQLQFKTSRVRRRPAQESTSRVCKQTSPRPAYTHSGPHPGSLQTARIVDTSHRGRLTQLCRQDCHIRRTSSSAWGDQSQYRCPQRSCEVRPRGRLDLGGWALAGTGHSAWARQRRMMQRHRCVACTIRSGRSGSGKMQEVCR